MTIDVDIRIRGMAEARRRARQLPQHLEEPVRRGLFAIALLAQNEARRLILDGPKTGRTYKRGAVVHQASAPGQAPANDTGQLAARTLAEAVPGEVAARVAARTGYARSLEYGTRKMAARPFLRRAARAAKEKGKAILADAVQRGLRAAGYGWRGRG